MKLTTGTLDYGQGHATPFAQVLSAELGVPFEKITLEQGDSDLVRFGNGTGGSRSITATGQAIVEASALVVAKGKQAAAHLMEASEGDIEFADGRFTIAGTDRSIGIMELAQRLREGKMPEGAPDTLDVDHATKDTPSTFPNGCHVAEVEIDPETGVTRIVRYFAVNDFGTVVNPMIVAGQLHGGVAQGIGQALMEEVSYDSCGQPITGLVHGLCACRAPRTFRRWKSATIPRRPKPIRWAPRAAAKPAAPAASSASSTRWSTRCRNTASRISTCR